MEVKLHDEVVVDVSDTFEETPVQEQDYFKYILCFGSNIWICGVLAAYIVGVFYIINEGQQELYKDINKHVQARVQNVTTNSKHKYIITVQLLADLQTCSFESSTDYKIDSMIRVYRNAQSGNHLKCSETEKLRHSLMQTGVILYCIFGFYAALSLCWPCLNRYELNHFY
jgi:hypothetical protein